MPNPKTPAVVFLDNLRKVEAGVHERRELFFQPLREVLTKATGIDKAGLNFTVLEQISFNRYQLIQTITRKSSKTSDGRCNVSKLLMLSESRTGPKTSCPRFFGVYDLKIAIFPELCHRYSSNFPQSATNCALVRNLSVHDV